MKKYIYIVLFAILLLYVNSHSKCLNEKFTDNKKINNIDAPNPHDILKTNKVKPILIEGNSELVPGYDVNSTDIYSEKYWVIKSQGFSDIYNYEDKSNLHLFLKPNPEESKEVKEVSNPIKEESNPIKEESNPIKEESNPIKEKNKEIQEKKISDNVLKSFTFQGPPKIFTYKSINYNLVATASNDYYSQYYYLYEFLTKQKNKLDYEENLKYIKNNQIYEYLLVKIHKNNPEVSHYIGPRNKININDIVYFSLGNFQLGPLKINKI